MTIVNASAATEAVFMTLVSDQVTFANQGAAFNSATEYSWETTGGDDIQAYGSNMDFNGSPPTSGLATLIEIDLSNNGFSTPDVVIDSITRPNAFGNPFTTARMSVITASATDFFNEILALDDTMTGSAFNDTFKAGGGADTLNMGAGNDSVFGGDGDDVINGEAGDDVLRGDAGDDTLEGGSGADTLNGGTGADDMDGGFNNDVYVVDNVGDVAAEIASGVDRVDASVTHTLSANIENLTLTGAAAIDGTGNFRANVINGNAAANEIDGAAGADTMAGGGGDDVYTVDNAGDTVIEGAGAGTDLVLSSVSFLMSANVENLILTGAAATNGTGNALNNVITGNGAANLLQGEGGADTLIGGGGFDTLEGDAGGDLMVGGGGADIMTGGTGFDVFDFNLTSESAPAAASRDLLVGFDNAGAAAGDVINLASIDANSGVGGNQMFAFLGWIQNPNPPATAPGSVWLRNEAGETVVYATINGGDAPEMAIRIADGATTAAMYAASDFVL